MKLFKKITALTIGLALLTGCSNIDKTINNTLTPVIEKYNEGGALIEEVNEVFTQEQELYQTILKQGGKEFSTVEPMIEEAKVLINTAKELIKDYSKIIPSNEVSGKLIEKLEKNKDNNKDGKVDMLKIFNEFEVLTQKYIESLNEVTDNMLNFYKEVNADIAFSILETLVTNINQSTNELKETTTLLDEKLELFNNLYISTYGE